MFFCVVFYPHIFISIKQSNRNLYFIISHFTLYYCIPIKNSQLYMYKIIIIYPLTAKVVGAPQMISQPVSSIFPCSPLPFGTWRTPGLSISWCCLHTSSPVCLVFFPLSLCLARWFWPDLINGRHDHTTAACVSLRWSEGLWVVQLPAGSWHRLPSWYNGLWMRCLVACIFFLFNYFNLCVNATGLVCHRLGLLDTDLHAVGCGGFVETLN